MSIWQLYQWRQWIVCSELLSTQWLLRSLHSIKVLSKISLWYIIIFVWYGLRSFSNIILVIWAEKILSFDNNGMEISVKSFVKYQLVGDDASVLGLPEPSGPEQKWVYCIIVLIFTEDFWCVEQCFLCGLIKNEFYVLHPLTYDRVLFMILTDRWKTFLYWLSRTRLSSTLNYPYSGIELTTKVCVFLLHE
jgi:hypothetical protein